MEASRRARSDPACDDARFAASLALDGALDDVGGLQLRRHLASCPDCARVVAEMEVASTLVRQARPARFRCEPAAGQLTRSCSSGSGRHWAGAAVAVAALVLATGALPRPHHAQTPTSGASVVVSPPALPIGQRSAMDDFAASAFTPPRMS